MKSVTTRARIEETFEPKLAPNTERMFTPLGAGQTSENGQLTGRELYYKIHEKTSLRR